MKKIKMIEVSRVVREKAYFRWVVLEDLFEEEISELRLEG